MKWLIGLIAVALVIWFGINLLSNNSQNKNNIPVIKVSAAVAERRDVPISISLSGNVVAYETVAIKSRIDSQIMEVKFHDGDSIEKGQALFVLDDRSLKTQIKQLEAALQKEKAQLENANRQYDRAKNLIANKFIPQAQLDEAKAAYNAQLAATAAAQANLDNTSILLSYTTISAPISGRVGTINVTQGNNVKANDVQPLVTINRVSPIRVQFAIPERYYEKIKSAMAGDVAVTATRKEAAETVQGKLEYIDNNIDTTTGSFIARAIFANEKESLWPGMFVTVAIELEKESGKLTIPAVSIQGDEGSRFVFKIISSKVVKTPVDVAYKIGDIAIIDKGLTDGEQVITDGLLRITDGAIVETAATKK